MTGDQHLQTVGETYTKHLRFALGTGARMILGGLACLVHGLVPFLFIHVGSDTIHDLNRRMILR